jgi:superfamily I DNA/RNA helicase
LLRRRGGTLWVRVVQALSDMEGISEDDDHKRQQEVVRKLDTFHAANRVDDPDETVQPEDAAKLLEAVETFIGLGALKASAPQYQHGDFFANVKKATKSFLTECMSDGVTWREGIARFRGDNQVPLLTITKSKGLEYDLVILLGLDDDQWWSFKNNPDEGHSTFFVAASRARDRLFMTICKGKQTAKRSAQRRNTGIRFSPSDRSAWRCILCNVLRRRMHGLAHRSRIANMASLEFQFYDGLRRAFAFFLSSHCSKMSETSI